MNFLLFSVFAPIGASLLCLVIRRIAKWITLLITFLVFVLSIYIFKGGEVSSTVLGLRSYSFSSVVFLFTSTVALLITMYSFKFMEEKERVHEYYAYLLLSLGSAAGVLFAVDYITLLLFWGISGLALYMLIGLGGPQATSAAKKTFIIVGGADALMILGIAIIWMLTRSLSIASWHIPINNTLTVIAFLSFLVAAFAKAGVMPLHSWIPDSAEVAPIPVTALLPAALDKLLGIYLLVRVCWDIFRITPNSAVSNLLLAIGSFTILSAVLGALVQHDFKKLLSFHAISQVGYMVLGIGVGLPLGLAGGIFHMFNNVIYKTCLFLCGGSVEFRTKKSDLGELGGLAKFMPLTFGAALVASLSISGVPPFNGFVSKWMIYQSLVELSKINPYWIIWLTAAMFGSAFTLASFIKFLHAIFLGQGFEEAPRVKEVPWLMWGPTMVLALFCIIFGVFAFSLPLRYFIAPLIGDLKIIGFWQPGLATGLLLFGLVLGWLVYALTQSVETVSKPAYLGGEIIPENEAKVSGVYFYDSVQKWGWLEKIYSWGEKKLFDLYDWGAKITFGLSGFLSWLHSGLLHVYLAWMFLGVIILLWVFLR